MTREHLLEIVAICLSVGTILYLLAPRFALPDVIVPPEAERVAPPPGEPLDVHGATRAFWYDATYRVPDLSLEQIVSFYRARFFRCTFQTHDDALAIFGDTHWYCHRSMRKAQGFGVWIWTPAEGSGENSESKVLIRVSIWAPF